MNNFETLGLVLKALLKGNFKSTSMQGLQLQMMTIQKITISAIYLTFTKMT